MFCTLFKNMFISISFKLKVEFELERYNYITNHSSMILHFFANFCAFTLKNYNNNYRSYAGVYIASKYFSAKKISIVKY